MIPVYRRFTDADIKNIAKKYQSRRSFKLGDQSVYIAALKRGIIADVCAHMDVRYRVMTDEQIADVAVKFNSRVEFLRADSAAYGTAERRGILDAVCVHMTDYRKTRQLSDDEVLETARRFSTRNDFKLGDFGAYTTAIRRGLIEAACAHMEYGACGFREDRPAIIYQFKIELSDGTVLYKVGITNRKPRQRLATMGVQRGTRVELEKTIKFPLGRDARIAEKRLHRANAACRYKGPNVMQNGNTELFLCPLL